MHDLVVGVWWFEFTWYSSCTYTPCQSPSPKLSLTGHNLGSLVAWVPCSPPPEEDEGVGAHHDQVQVWQHSY